MIASATRIVSPAIADTPRPRRWDVTPVVEATVLVVAIGIAVGSYFVIAGSGSRAQLLSPPLVALLLIANLIPGVALMMLFGRRIAMRRAARSPIGGKGQLHVRLVAVFSIMAAVPMILVAIFASLLFQYGVEFWSSQRARGMLENARSLVRENYQRQIDDVARNTLAMSSDLAATLGKQPIEGDYFQRYLLYQTYQRQLSEAMILRRGDPNPLIVLSPYGRALENVVTPGEMARLDSGRPAIIVQNKDRAAAIVPIAYGAHTYLYAARVFDEAITNQLRRGDAILADYRALQTRSRNLQLRFNAALFAISLLIVGLAVWIALAVADRMVRPVGELVDAARRVAAGDLGARVADPRRTDEVGTLANAFNRMTERLEVQKTELLTANDQLENRRALIEAVMAGVSAGVVAIGATGTIQIANASAVRLLGRDADGLVDARLRDIAPELDALLAEPTREAIVQVGQGGEAKTLAVRIARTDAGPILTFDDITQQVLDQRRAAWSDVARRIAHEIKNPLTPIQLAAERLQRRYGSKVEEGDVTFARLTDTIVRQVGDLRRMVDEFSSFARMPKPVFREELLIDTARQSLFLHEVAHPGIRFFLDHVDAGPTLICDRRQIGQALTNIVKNAVEAIEAKGDPQGSVTMTLGQAIGGTVTITVADTGVGLPAERDRIVEPYMTTRARGTGLGLAIVKKIVEEHHGTIAFSDRPGGGTLVSMTFDANALAAQQYGDTTELGGEGQLATLTRNRI